MNESRRAPDGPTRWCDCDSRWLRRLIATEEQLYAEIGRLTARVKGAENAIVELGTERDLLLCRVQELEIELGRRPEDEQRPLTAAESRARNYREWGGDCPIAPDPFDDPIR